MLSCVQERRIVAARAKVGLDRVASTHVRARDGHEIGARVPFISIVGAGAFAAAISIGALVAGGSRLPLLAQLLLIGLTMVPWVPRLPQRWLSWTFVFFSLVPTLVFTWTGGSPVLFALLALACARVASSASFRRGLAFLFAALGIVIGREVVAGISTEWWMWSAYIDLGAVSGCALHAQRELVRKSRVQRDEHAKVAALEERRRIARDVHDVLAHTLTILMVHVNSARMTVRDDPEGTEEVLDEVAKMGRRCLEEIRRSVGLLSEPPGGGESTGPIESARGLEKLVASYRNAGVDVDLLLDVEMEQMGLLSQASQEMWFASHGIVREALANATKHASGGVIVLRITVDDAAMHIVCSNPIGDGPVALALPRGGNGIEGMRERVAAVGGTFSAGPEDTNWVVRAQLPMTTAAVADRRPATLGRAS
jgi:signal transduction histidine kinase